MRLHSAIGYITPADKLTGLENVIFAERDRKLEEAESVEQQLSHGHRRLREEHRRATNDVDLGGG